jgi:Protein of unknown function (DUF2924)
MVRVKSGPRVQTEGSLADEIAHLRNLDLKGLRSRWQSVTGREAAHHLPRHLLFALLAYRIQADAMGDLDADTVRHLKKIGSARSNPEAVPLTEAFDQRRRELLLGTVLKREWNGHNHQVMVVDNGFCWEGRTYDSLSKIAREITGTKWNGPRFFGLRDKPPPQAQQ